MRRRIKGAPANLPHERKPDTVNAATQTAQADSTPRVMRATLPASDKHAALDVEYVRLIDATDTRPAVWLLPCPNRTQRAAIAQLAGRAGEPEPPANERTVCVIVRAGHEAEDFDKLCPTDPANPLYWIREGRVHVPVKQTPGKRRRASVRAA
jgi:hypothetical protein